MLATALSLGRIPSLIPGRVRIVHGLHGDTFPVAGYAVEVVRNSLRYVFNVAADAKPLVNGFEVDRSYRLADGDVVEFVRSWGRKGGVPDQENGFDYITLAEASKLIPGRTPGRKVSLDSICRWCQRGIRGIRLRSVLIGGRRFTTRKWLADFIEASQKSETEYPTDAVPRTTKQLNQAADDASRQLRSVWKNYRRQH